MKKLIALLLVAILFGCENKNIESKQSESVINGCSIIIYTIDSCEYIGYVYGSNHDILTHKGNCKFCTKRNIHI